MGAFQIFDGWWAHQPGQPTVGCLTTWFAFMPQDSSGTSVMLMGDMVLLESEF